MLLKLQFFVFFFPELFSLSFSKSCRYTLYNFFEVSLRSCLLTLFVPRVLALIAKTQCLLWNSAASMTDSRKSVQTVQIGTAISWNTTFPDKTADIISEI